MKKKNQWCHIFKNEGSSFLRPTKAIHFCTDHGPCFWSLASSRHGQTTVCTRHFTGLPSVGMSTDTLPSCSPSPAARFRRPMNLWVMITLHVSSLITTTTSCDSLFLRKALATKISSGPTVDYRQQNASAVQPARYTSVESALRDWDHPCKPELLQYTSEYIYCSLKHEQSGILAGMK